MQSATCNSPGWLTKKRNSSLPLYPDAPTIPIFIIYISPCIFYFEATNHAGILAHFEGNVKLGRNETQHILTPTAFELLGFAIVSSMLSASKGSILRINEMDRCLLSLNPTYAYFHFYSRTHVI